jgi:putative ABC transport system ATP-binding protein
VLELRDLVKHYQDGGADPIRAVDGVSMRVAAGELAVLYGPSGSGKTTLLEIVAGLLDPDAGSVLVDGRDVFARSRQERDEYRLRDLGIVGQPQNLIPGAMAIENASVKLWLSSADRRAVALRAESLLEALGLSERMRHRTEQLSMGERQRVMIARALSTSPKLVLADEPTGNLDTHRTREVLGLLRDLCKRDGVAIVLATHDPIAAAFADQVHELSDGKLQAYEPDHTPHAPPRSVL